MSRMDLLYSIGRRQSCNSSKPASNTDFLHNGPTLCAMSSQSVIALSTVTELDDAVGKTWGSQVYVTDLNVPWHCYKVLSNKSTVTVLEWDHPGDTLLVGDMDGNVQLWARKDHLLNEWVCLGTVTYRGEHVLAALFFHNGRKLSLAAEIKESAFYNEKFNNTPCAPSVRSFGGSPLDGCIIVTATRMVGAIICSQEGRGVESLIHSSESLCSTRGRITATDICYGKSENVSDGHFVVAVSSGEASLPVFLVRVTVKQVDEQCVITTRALRGFFLHSGSIKDFQYRTVSQLKFANRCDPESLVVAANSETGCRVELWELHEESKSVHKIFLPKNPNQNETYTSTVWKPQCHYVVPSQVLCLTTPKISLTSVTPAVGYLVLALKDGSIHCLFRDTLKLAAQTTQNIAFDDPSNLKQQRVQVRISFLDLSWLGLMLASIDTRGHLYMYKIPPASEGGGAINIPYAATLLEYCLQSGIDWWEVLLSLRTNIVESVIERFTENFNRQIPAVQQFHYIKHLNIKTSIYRLITNGQTKAADMTSLLMLHSVATAFKSLLRPSDLSNHDKGPAESLANVMTESITDVDKVLLHLEAKDFAVEPSTLQSLQQLIQWVADLTLNILARLPEQRQGSNRGSGYELLKDYKSLNTLRELLVLIRIWGLLRQSCLPVFVRSAENLDVLALLFKLLSRLIQNSEPDDNLVDDCCLLPNQVVIPPLTSPQKLVTIASPTFFCMSSPIQLEWGVEPESLVSVPDVNVVEGAMQSDQIIDCIRHIYLGRVPSVVKQCTRCGGMALLQFSTRTAAIKAWDMRWARQCICGGHWRVQRFVTI